MEEGAHRVEHETPRALASGPRGETDDAPEATRCMAEVDAELQQDAARRLRQAILGMEQFLLREDLARPHCADPTRKLCDSLCAEARELLREALRASGAAVQESTLRSAYRLAGALGSLVAWNAPATQESQAMNSFPCAKVRDDVAYARYGCAETAAQEAVYTSMLGFDAQRARLLLTSSGMAAYALIEAFLLRDVLKPQDCVLLNPGIYFETRHQLQSLPFFDVKIARGGARSDTLEALIEHRPRVVFVDPLTNSADLRLIDLAQLLDCAEHVCERETWFVVDGTLLSGCFDPFAKRRRNVRVLYYESGCKYLQFGTDLGPAGVVVVEMEFAERFEHWRRGIGAIGAQSLVLPSASRNAYLTYLREQTACARAVAAAAQQRSAECGAAIECSFPSQSSHPDFAEAARYPHLGGVLVFRFLDDQLNRRQPLEAFIDRLIALARLRRVPLTAGVSFGFRVPRIGAAWSSYHAQDAFLRLSAGVDHEGAARLGSLIVECAGEFARAQRRAG